MLSLSLILNPYNLNSTMETSFELLARIEQDADLQQSNDTTVILVIMFVRRCLKDVKTLLEELSADDTSCNYLTSLCQSLNVLILSSESLKVCINNFFSDTLIKIIQDTDQHFCKLSISVRNSIKNLNEVISYASIISEDIHNNSDQMQQSIEHFLQILSNALSSCEELLSFLYTWYIARRKVVSSKIVIKLNTLLNTLECIFEKANNDIMAVYTLARVLLSMFRPMLILIENMNVLLKLNKPTNDENLNVDDVILTKYEQGITSIKKFIDLLNRDSLCLNDDTSHSIIHSLKEIHTILKRDSLLKYLSGAGEQQHGEEQQHSAGDYFLLEYTPSIKHSPGTITTAATNNADDTRLFTTVTWSRTGLLSAYNSLTDNIAYYTSKDAVDENKNAFILSSHHYIESLVHTFLTSNIDLKEEESNEQLTHIIKLISTLSTYISSTVINDLINFLNRLHNTVQPNDTSQLPTLQLNRISSICNDIIMLEIFNDDRTLFKIINLLTTLKKVLSLLNIRRENNLTSSKSADLDTVDLNHTAYCVSLIEEIKLLVNNECGEEYVRSVLLLLKCVLSNRLQREEEPYVWEKSFLPTFVFDNKLLQIDSNLVTGELSIAKIESLISLLNCDQNHLLTPVSFVESTTSKGDTTLKGETTLKGDDTKDEDVFHNNELIKALQDASDKCEGSVLFEEVKSAISLTTSLVTSVICEAKSADIDSEYPNRSPSNTSSVRSYNTSCIDEYIKAISSFLIYTKKSEYLFPESKKFCYGIFVSRIEGVLAIAEQLRILIKVHWQTIVIETGVMSPELEACLYNLRESVIALVKAHASTVLTINKKIITNEDHLPEIKTALRSPPVLKKIEKLEA